MKQEGCSSSSQAADEFYKTAHQVELNPGDAGGPQADFFERFLKNNSDVNNDRIRTLRQGYLFTSRLHSNKKKGKPGKRPHNLLTVRERKKLGIFQVSSGDVRYDTFKEVHELWEGYFREAIGTDRTANLTSMQPALMKADYTGCYFVVAASKCPSLVGMKGFVVQETKNCFRLITEDEKIVCIPKKGSLFAFSHDDKVYKIYGSHFRKHGFERGKIKFKVTEKVDL